MIEAYSKLSNGQKRLVIAGYFGYLIWVFFLDGWDSVLESPIESISDNPFFMIVAMLSIYWIIVFIFLWVKDGFDD